MSGGVRGNFCITKVTGEIWLKSHGPKILAGFIIDRNNLSEKLGEKPNIEFQESLETLKNFEKRRDREEGEKY